LAPSRWGCPSRVGAPFLVSIPPGEGLLSLTAPGSAGRCHGAARAWEGTSRETGYLAKIAVRGSTRVRVTVEMLAELYRAREELSRPGARTDLSPIGDRSKTWNGYLSDVGLSWTTTARWLAELYRAREELSRAATRENRRTKWNVEYLGYLPGRRRSGAYHCPPLARAVRPRDEYHPGDPLPACKAGRDQAGGFFPHCLSVGTECHLSCLSAYPY